MVKVLGKALVVPVVALAVWAFPSDQPEVAVAGAIEVAPEIVTTSIAVDVGLESASSIFEPLADATPRSALTSTTPAALVTVEAVVPTTTSTPETLLEPDLEDGSTTVRTAAPLSLGEQAIDRVTFDWRTPFPTWRIEFRGARDGIRALTYPAERRIEIFIRPTDTANSLHRVFAHELGHVIDVEMNSDRDRDRWLDQRAIPRVTPWWPTAESPDFATGAGDFAEAFAVWETGVSTRSTIGDQPDSADVELLIELAQG
jgi:hypothetical protein